MPPHSDTGEVIVGVFQALHEAMRSVDPSIPTDLPPNCFGPGGRGQVLLRNSRGRKNETAGKAQAQADDCLSVSRCPAGCRLPRNYGQGTLRSWRTPKASAPARIQKVSLHKGAVGCLSTADAFSLFVLTSSCRIRAMFPTSTPFSGPPWPAACRRDDGKPRLDCRGENEFIHVG